MNLDATTISLIALGISIFSLLIAFYNSDVDRRIQIEQLKGEMLTRLTYRGVDIIGDIKKLEMTPSEETFELLKDLIKVAEGIGNIRQGIMQLPKTPPIFGSAIMPSLQRTLNDIDDAEPIFDKLSEDIANWDLKEVRQTTDNLLERLFGSDSSKSASSNKAKSADAKSRAADLRRSAAGSKKLQMNFKATRDNELGTV